MARLIVCCCVHAISRAPALFLCQDALEQREPVGGWSAPRCENLGASMLDAVDTVLPLLRAEFPFGNGCIGAHPLAPPTRVRQLR